MDIYGYKKYKMIKSALIHFINEKKDEYKNNKNKKALTVK